MKKVLIDLTGKTFGLWTVVERSYERAAVTKAAFWVCRCACGTQKAVSSLSLRNGTSKSCGCDVNYKHETKNVTHGRSKTPEYRAWGNMINRCENPEATQWDYYGGRGIKVCQEWRESFEAFYAHIGPRPSSKHSVDRIDGNKDYEPGNVRWATKKIQSSNRRNVRLIEIGGEKMSLTDWSVRVGLKPSVVRRRLGRGWSVEQAFGLTGD